MTLLSSRDGACSSVPSPLLCDTVKILYDDATRPRGDGFGIYQRSISSLDILHLVLWLRGGSRVSTLSAPITAFQISKNTFVHGSLFWVFFRGPTHRMAEVCRSGPYHFPIDCDVARFLRGPLDSIVGWDFRAVHDLTLSRF